MNILKSLIKIEQRIGMSSVMMSAIEMSKKENFIRDLKTFLATKNCSFSFIMGAVVQPEMGSLKRDILIYPAAATAATILATQLPLREELKLSKPKIDISMNDVVVFKQGDASFSRKKMLPIIKKLLQTKM